jgi:hypothetical protein
VSDIFDPPDDAATPLSVEEQRDLIPSHISNRRELNLGPAAAQARSADGEIHHRSA